MSFGLPPPRSFFPVSSVDTQCSPCNGFRNRSLQFEFNPSYSFQINDIWNSNQRYLVQKCDIPFRKAISRSEKRYPVQKCDIPFRNAISRSEMQYPVQKCIIRVQKCDLVFKSAIFGDEINDISLTISSYRVGSSRPPQQLHTKSFGNGLKIRTVYFNKNM